MADKAGYGKRPLWQWVLIYIIIGAIVYYAIYHFVLSKGGYGGSAASPQTQQNGFGY